MKQDKIPEKAEIEQTLAKLEVMYANWELNPKDWVVVDEIAYVLQGYEVIAEEMKTRHLDTYVDITKLPWRPNKERSIIPPAKSKFFDDYCNFIESTDFGLDMLATTHKDKVLKQPMVNYKLPNGKEIQLMEAKAMTKQFWQRTLMYYSPEDVSPEKVKEWLDKLELIAKVALKKRNKKLAKDCQEMLTEAQEKWSSALSASGIKT